MFKACVTRGPWRADGTGNEVILKWAYYGIGYCTIFQISSLRHELGKEERFEIVVFRVFSFFAFASAKYIIQTHSCCQSHNR